MELIDWIGLFFALTPVWAGLGYGLLRLTKRLPPPEGVPPGRVGGMSPGAAWGAPGGDAPAYAQKLRRDAEAEERRRRDTARHPPPEG